MFPSGWMVNTLKVVLENDKKLKKEKKKRTNMPIASWLSQRIKGGVQGRRKKKKVFPKLKQRNIRGGPAGRELFLASQP